MRALWVTAIPPSPDGGGGHIRQAHLLRSLADRFEVCLVVAGGPPHPDVVASVAEVVQVEGASAPPPTSRLRRRLSALGSTVLRGVAPEIGAHDDVRGRLAAALDAAPPAQLVQVEYLGLAPLVSRRRDEHWAITLHNLPSGMEAHRADVAAGRRQRALHRRAAATSRRAERSAAAAYDTTIVCSADDAAALGGAPIVVPNGVDLERFRCTDLPTAPVVLFSGALNTAPNVDGLTWFVTEVWPAIRAARPDALLHVVGMTPVDEVVAACRAAGVTLRADVPSIVPHLEAARVSVVPLRVGTGSRLKALEAMAAGRPVVGTRIGLGGLAVEDGCHAEVADDAPAFATAVARLLDDDGRARRLAEEGRALVASRYDWRRIGADYAAAMADRCAGTLPRRR